MPKILIRDSFIDNVVENQWKLNQSEPKSRISVIIEECNLQFKEKVWSLNVLGFWNWHRRKLPTFLDDANNRNVQSLLLSPQ